MTTHHWKWKSCVNGRLSTSHGALALAVEPLQFDQPSSSRCLRHWLQFERERLRERTIAGLDRARAQGKRLGGPTEEVPLDKLAAVKDISVREGAKRLGVARSTLQRWRALARQIASVPA